MWDIANIFVYYVLLIFSHIDLALPCIDFLCFSAIAHTLANYVVFKGVI